MSYNVHTQPGELARALHRIRTATSLLSFRTVCVTGISGIVPGAIFTHETDRALAILRKGEQAHGPTVEAPPHALDDPYVLLDDVIETGATINRLLAIFRKPVAIVLYNQGACPLLPLPGFTGALRGLAAVYLPEAQ